MAPDRKRFRGFLREEIEQFTHDPARFARLEPRRAREVGG